MPIQTESEGTKMLSTNSNTAAVSYFIMTMQAPYNYLNAISNVDIFPQIWFDVENEF